VSVKARACKLVVSGTHVCCVFVSSLVCCVIGSVFLFICCDFVRMCVCFVFICTFFVKAVRF
jgi:hypothetical protein